MTWRGVWSGGFLGVALAWTGAAAKVPTPSVQQLAEAAEVVVVGRVAEIVTVPGVRAFHASSTRIAIVAVEETLKGPVAARWAYVASRHSFCDVTTAQIGERAVFFLAEVAHCHDAEPHAAPLAAASRFGVERLHAIAYSGRGRWPIRLLEGVEHAELRDVFLSDGIPVVDGGTKASPMVYMSVAVLREILGVP
ncbi:MAG TPA: hypothetical protein VFV75_12105 [Candidatus Polarisedimenticolaceae bacterium]|nr:hypothetical protein [Candidatus Polarisedimenticolaceae bacterium]